MQTRPILILKTGETLPDVRTHCGDFEDWIASGLCRGVDGVEVVSVYQGDPLPPVERFGGVVITGSPAMVSERAEWSERSAHWLAEIVARDALPVLGLCYGHQLLAHGLGGEVGPNPKGREMGTIEVVFSAPAPDATEPDPLFASGALHAHFSHVEAVLRPPNGSRLLASSRLDPHSAIEFGPRQWGVQFHPEFDREIMRRYVDARREILIREALDPDLMIAATAETPRANRLLSRFAAFVDRG